MQNFRSIPIDDTETLRQVYDKAPSRGALGKCLGHLDNYARHCISLTPFVVLATSDGSTSSHGSHCASALELARLETRPNGLPRER